MSNYDLRQKYEDFIEKARQRGSKILAYDCPHCEVVLETLAAPRDDTWDSFSTCPYCGSNYLKVVTNSDAYGRTL